MRTEAVNMCVNQQYLPSIFIRRDGKLPSLANILVITYSFWEMCLCQNTTQFLIETTIE